MPTILDQVSLASARFSPSTVEEYFALALARKLGDPHAAPFLVRLVSQHARYDILGAYGRALLSPDSSDLVRSFHVELGRTNGGWGNGHLRQLMALRIDRRSISVALFAGEKLEYTQSRDLSSVREKALESSLAFTERTINQFGVESAALETVVNGHDIQRRILTNEVTSLLRNHGVPVWEVGKHDMFDAYGVPPPRARKDLRPVICTIWPGLADSRPKVFVQDAAALGLYIQIERLFIN